MTKQNDLEAKVARAVERCFDESLLINDHFKTYSFLASKFAADGKDLFEGELQKINAYLRDPVTINLYGRYSATTYCGNKGLMVAFQPIADLEDIIELEL